MQLKKKKKEKRDEKQLFVIWRLWKNLSIKGWRGGSRNAVPMDNR